MSQRKKTTLDEARAARKPVGAVHSEAEDAETLAQAQLLHARKRAAEHPVQQECAALGKELNALGMQWAFGNAVNTQFMDFQPGVYAEALAQILIEDYGLPVERWQDVVFAILRGKLETTRDAALEMKRQQQSGLIVPDAPQVPPDLFTGPESRIRRD